MPTIPLPTDADTLSLLKNVVGGLVYANHGAFRSIYM